jgi:PAS domain S-box-containing protein
MNQLTRNRPPIFEESGEHGWLWLADSMADIVWTADLDLRLTYLNQAMTRVLGYDIEEMKYKPFSSICTPDSGEMVARKLTGELKKDNIARIDRERVWTLEIRNACKDGSTLWTETKIGFLLGSGGEPEGFIGISRDITERRRKENILHQGKLLAIIGEMTSAIATEINNPVGGILLSSEQLMLGNVSRQTMNDLSMIHGEAKRVARMMSSLLNSCNLAPQKMERYKLHRLLNKVLEIRKYAHETRNIIVSTDLQKLPLYVICDTHQLQQVFTRLIQDAETALQKQKGGNIVITSRKQGEWAKVSIADDRQTHMHDYLDQYLGPIFARTDPNTDVTRLDRILCHGVVTAHGGQLYSESNRMGGNTFVVELPVCQTRDLG